MDMLQTLLRDYRRAVKDDPAPLLALFAEEAARAEAAEAAGVGLRRMTMTPTKKQLKTDADYWRIKVLLDVALEERNAALARAEAAEALAYQRLEDALFAEQRATDADIHAEETEADASRLRLELMAANLDIEALAARVADLEAQLEAQLAAQQWRPVTEKPLIAMQYQVVVQHSRQQPAADHMAYYPSSGWTGTDVIYWRPIPPLPPLPDAAEEPTP